MIKKILSIIILLFTINNAFATHLVGGEMTYTHISGNTYQLTLTVYRDDFYGNPGALFDAPAVIYAYEDNGSYAFEINMNLSNPSTSNNYIQEPNLNPCLIIPNDVKIQKGVYTKNITVPNGAKGYHLVYGRCCRNGALINNLNNPADQGIGITTHIPPTTTYSNNSAKFNLQPPIFICVGSPLSRDQSVSDIDGDSIHYKMCTPWQALTPTDPANTPGNPPPFGFGPPFTPVVWQAPFNQNNPLGGVPITIDPNTGLVSGTPNSVGTFVVGICVEEWRNGVLLNTLLRDFPYTVTNCNIPTAAIPIVGSVAASSLSNLPSIPETILGVYELNCDSLEVKFKNTSTLPNGSAATASNGSYYWSFGDGATSTAFSPNHTYLDTGTFLVKSAITVGVGNQSCTDTGYYIVYVYPVFKAKFTVDNTCANVDAEFVDVSTAANYDNVISWNWNFGDGSATSTLQNPKHDYLNPGTYTVILNAESEKGCFKSDTNRVTIHHVPKAIMNVPNQLCMGDTFKFTSSSTLAQGTIDSFYWNLDVGVNSTLKNPSNYYPNTGTYPISLQAISNFGCIDSVKANLTVNALPTITTSGNDTICPNTSIQVNAGGGVTYVWTPAGPLNNANINNPTITPLTPQYYTVKVTDANNCVNSDSIFIGIKPPPPANAGIDTSVCLNLTNVISYNTTVPLNATGGVSYLWTPAAGLSATNIANPIASPTITTEYIVTVSDIHNCTANDTVKVVVLNPALELIQVSTDSLCFGDTIVLEVIDLGAITSYTWSPATFVTDAAINEPGFFPPVNSIYTLTITNYCYQDNDSVLIEVIPLPVLDAGALDSICIGDPAYQLEANPSDLAIYQWTSLDNSISNPNIYNPTISPTVSSTYYLLAIDSVGTLACANTDSVKILVFQNPTLNISFAADYLGFICQGDSVKLTANSNDAIIFNWDADNTLSSVNSQNTFAFPQDTNQYFVTVENIHACINRDSIVVNVQSPINPAMSGDSIMCYGFYVNLEATGGLYYHWYPTEGNFSNINYGITQARLDSSLTIYVDISNDCFNDTIYKNITVYQLPEVNAGDDFRILRDDEAGFLDGSGDGKPLWYTDKLNFYGLLNSPAQYSPEVQPEVTTNYILEIENPVTGCKNYDTMTVFVDVLTLLALPTGFSPNGDGVNDFVSILKYLNIKTLDDFSIFSRNGEKVFSTSDLKAKWDGTYKGVDLELGVYTYMIKAVSKDNESILRKGDITLIR